jgi:hypothetical protein
MSTRSASGTRFKQEEDSKAAKAKKVARLWSLVKAVIRMVDSSEYVSKGVYRINPEAMIEVKHFCDEFRFDLKMQRLEIAKAEKEDQDCEQ